MLTDVNNDIKHMFVILHIKKRNQLRNILKAQKHENALYKPGRHTR